MSVLADYAAVAAAGSTLDDGWSMATLSSESHNLAPAAGSKLVAIGQIVKPGRRHLLARADVHIESDDGPLCLTGLFTATGVPPRASSRLGDATAIGLLPPPRSPGSLKG